MMKKFTALFCALVLCLSLASCAGKDDTSETLELVPYTASYTDSTESEFGIKVRYGLMTTDGKPHTEAKYNLYNVFEKDGKTYYCLKVTEGDWEPVCYDSLLISTDGMFELAIADNIVALSENRIICAQYEGGFNVYDYSGNKIFSGKDTQSLDTDSDGFYNGLLLVYDFLSDNDDMQVRDENGNLVLNGLDYCEHFISGKAVATYNRDEAYGIISPEGEWLLEPVYTDISSVDGKYFIAINYDTEEIYDTNLNLISKKPCSPFVEHQFYYFEKGDKLIKHYSHMDAPDDFYYDALTNEPISCNRVNATNYMEYFDYFYAIQNGTALVFDENGKLLSQHENAQRIEEHEGAYAVIHTDKTVDYFSAQTHEKLITLTCEDGEYKPVTAAADCEYIAVGDLKDIGDSFVDGFYHLYNYKSSEYVLRDCEYCEIKEFNGKAYITAVYTDRVETYDSSFNLLIKTENK